MLRMLGILDHYPATAEALQKQRTQCDTSRQLSCFSEILAVDPDEPANLGNIDSKGLESDIVVEDLQHAEEVLAVIVCDECIEVELDRSAWK